MNEKKMDFNSYFYDYSLILLGGLLGIAAVMSVITYSDDIEMAMRSFHMVEQDYNVSTWIHDCQNKTTVEDSVQCLMPYIEDIYSYNVTDDDWELRLADLIRRGGDCRDWTLLWEHLLNQLGYDTKQVRYYNNESGHVFLLAWTEEQYCTIDQVLYECTQTLG